MMVKEVTTICFSRVIPRLSLLTLTQRCTTITHIPLWPEWLKHVGDRYTIKLLFSNATTCPSWTMWSPSCFWLKCNRLLRLGRP
jgi:hypothetical protein